MIAHEIGHHVQNLLGISGKVQQMRESMSKRDGNALSVRIELQADCFAGVWANRADKQRGGKMIDDKDVEQALAAASGDRRRRAAAPDARAASCPTASPTAPARSACAGSARAWTAATCRSAILSGAQLSL